MLVGAGFVQAYPEDKKGAEAPFPCQPNHGDSTG